MKLFNLHKGKNNFAFTLVELVVVVTILVLLGTIGFISFNGYLSGTRDSNRLAQLNKIHDGIQIHIVKGNTFLPEDKIEIKHNGELISYQGYAGKNVLKAIEYDEKGVDPLTGEYFSYYITKNRKHTQLMTYLEENFRNKAYMNTSYANEYGERFPYVVGKKLGILVSKDSNEPIQKISHIYEAGEIDIATTSEKLITHLNNFNITEGDFNVIQQLKKVASVGGKQCTVSGTVIACIGDEVAIIPTIPTITAVNGACNNNVQNGCSSGVSNDAAVADTSTHYRWACQSTSGGTDDTSCNMIIPEVPLYTFTSHRFTNCNNGGGATGPTLSQCVAAYNPVDGNWDTDPTLYSSAGMQGYQLWTVPETATYTIEAAGGNSFGSDGAGAAINTWGYGFRMQADFDLSKGEKLIIIVGQSGYGVQNPHRNMAGGGGGSFVVKQSHPSISNLTTSDILMIAGGAGGVYDGNVNSACMNGSAGTTGKPDCGNRNNGGFNGYGGYGGTTSKGSSGGGGFLTDGYPSTNSPGLSFYNGLVGGDNDKGTQNGLGVGGFGGGSGGNKNGWGAGGGGGYSGGGGSEQSTGGGGGGSIHNGTNYMRLSSRIDVGYVIITKKTNHSITPIKDDI